jgi:hypothetical protein
MNKYLLSIFISASLVQVNAQCTPDGSETVPGMHPTQLEGLAAGFEGTPYAQTLTVIIPTDTIVDVFGIPTTVPITSATVTSVSGLPAGFSYACNVSGCIFPGGSTNCAIITGNPGVGSAGTYPLNVFVTYLAGFITADDTVTGYVININALGIWEVQKNNSLAVTASPNPFTYNSTIEFLSPANGDVKITVYDLLGKPVKSETIRANYGENTYLLKGDDLIPGAYLIELYDGKTRSAKQLLKQ